MVYQIHQYPADLIDVLHLPDAGRVVVRPVLPQDEALTDAYFRDLRAASRYDRFLGPMRALPPSLIAHLTQVDYSSHLALVAAVVADGRETVIAEARYARGADKTSAEFAVSVADAWQGRGLARLLLGKIAPPRRRCRRDPLLRRDAGRQRAPAAPCPQGRLHGATQPRRGRPAAPGEGADRCRRTCQQRWAPGLFAGGVALSAGATIAPGAECARKPDHDGAQQAQRAPPAAGRTPAPARMPKRPAP